MSLVRDFFGGVSSAMGFQAGMNFMTRREQRPILRKRFATTVAYVVFTLWALGKSISIEKKNPPAHFFREFLEELGANNVFPGSFPILMFLISLMVMLSVVYLYRRPDKSIWVIPTIPKSVTLISFSAVLYATSYDIAYYAVGNTDFFFDLVHFNFASNAHFCASTSVVIYLFRSIFFLVPTEVVTETFMGDDIRKITGPGVYVIPTLPVPYLICIFLIYVSDMVPLFWDMWHHPDGRENPQQINIRNV